MSVASTIALDLSSWVSDLGSNLQSDPRLTGWTVTMAVVALLAGWLGGRLARRATDKAIQPIKGLGDNARHMIARLAQYLMWMVGIGLALTFLGAPIQPLLAVAIIVGAVAVLALRGVADNFAAGVVLQTRQPVQVGDDIEALDYVGVIKEMSGRSVVIETYDGELVHLPNKKVLDNPLVNNSANGARRTELEVRTGRADLDHLVAIVNDVLTGNDDIADDPPAAVHITSIGRDEIILLVRVWHRPGLTRSVSSAVCRSLYGALTEASIDGTVVTPPPTAHP